MAAHGSDRAAQLGLADANPAEVGERRCRRSIFPGSDRARHGFRESARAAGCGTRPASRPKRSRTAATRPTARRRHLRPSAPTSSAPIPKNSTKKLPGSIISTARPRRSASRPITAIGARPHHPRGRRVNARSAPVVESKLTGIIRAEMAGRRAEAMLDARATRRPCTPRRVCYGVGPGRPPRRRASDRPASLPRSRWRAWSLPRRALPRDDARARAERHAGRHSDPGDREGGGDRRAAARDERHVAAERRDAGDRRRFRGPRRASSCACATTPRRSRYPAARARADDHQLADRARHARSGWGQTLTWYANEQEKQIPSSQR